MDIVMEQYTIQQLRSHPPEHEAVHKHERAVVHFGRRLYPMLQTPFRAICQELCATAEQDFINVVQHTGILATL